MNNDNHNNGNKNKRPLISVCIPAYEMGGRGVEFLGELFESLKKQTFRDFDAVVSDHSKDGKIKELCERWQKQNAFPLHYFPYAENRGSSSANLNNAIRHADGKLIKILFMDDFLYSKKSLEHIADNFDLDKDRWLVTGFTHTKDLVHFYGTAYPTYTKTIHLGKNTIGSPSVLTIKNDHPLFFDTNLIWLMDCDYYKRCHDAFGPPKIVKEISVANRISAQQISSTMINEVLREKEYEYMVQKFGERKTVAGNVRYVSRKIKRNMHTHGILKGKSN